MMSIGVTYDEFWNGDPELIGYAIESETIRQKNAMVASDMTAWNIGRYVQLAVGVVLSQAFSRSSTAKYPSEPQIGPELDERLAEQKRERELLRARDGFLALASAMWSANGGE